MGIDREIAEKVFGFNGNRAVVGGYVLSINESHPEAICLAALEAVK